MDLQRNRIFLKEDDVFKLPKILFQQKINNEYRLVFNPGIILPNPSLTGGPTILDPLHQKIFDMAIGKTVRETSNLFRNFSESEFEMHVSTLLERGLLVVGEETEPDFEKIPNGLRTIKASLMLTNRCNKNCPGCYMEKGQLSMTKEIGEKAIDSVISSAEKRGFGKIKFFFFGGEPLLEWDLIRHLLAYADKKYSAKIESNKVQFMIATNGMLLDKSMFEDLRRYKVMMLISIGNILNSNIDNEKRKMFWDNMLATHEILRGRAAVVAMMTATMENLPHLPAIVKELLDRKKTGIRITLAKFSKHNNVPSQEFLETYAEKSIKYIGECFDIMKTNLLLKKRISTPISKTYFLGFNFVLDSMSILWPKRKICGVGTTLFMIDQLGRICSCQLAMDNPLGSLNDDAIEIAQKQNLEINCFRMSVCRDCNLRFTCAGHCQKSVMRATGNYGPSVHCKIYKALVPKWLDLQGFYITRHPELPQFIK